jgi:hypothetical protein
MDPDKIFSLFEPSNNCEKYTNSALIDFTQSSDYNIKMFIKVFKNSRVLENKIIKLLENTHLDNKDINDVNLSLLFNTAWKYISLIDPTIDYDTYLIKNIDDSSFDINLKKMIKYFEGIEEYEKCILINSIYKIRKENS